MCPPTRRVQASARVTPRAAGHYRDSRTALHNTWPTVIMTTHSAGQPGPGSPQTAPAAAQSASVADPPLHCRSVILPHAAAGLAQGKKIALLPAITSGKTGIPGCCQTRPKHKIPTKAHKLLLAGVINPWSGAGSNRRPSACQGFCHPRDHSPESIQKPSSHALSLVSWSNSHHSDSAAEYRIVPFRLWAFCGGLRPTADLWGNCGPRGCMRPGADRSRIHLPDG